MLPQELEPRPMRSFLEDLQSSSLKLISHLEAKRISSIEQFVSKGLVKPGERIIVEECLEAIPEALPLSTLFTRDILTGIDYRYNTNESVGQVILIDEQLFREIKPVTDQIGYEVIANADHSSAFISIQRLTRLLHSPATLDEKKDEKKTLEHVIHRISEQLRNGLNKEQALDSTKKGFAMVAGIMTIPLLMSVTIPTSPYKEPTSE